MPKQQTAYQVDTADPVITAAGAYATGDQLGTLQEIRAVVRTSEKDFSGSELLQVVIIDQANQKAAIDLLFFDASPTITSSDNDAIAIADDQMQTKCIGSLEILAADYDTALTGASGNAVATIRNVGLIFKASEGVTSIFVIAVVRGTPTYLAIDDLRFKYYYSRL